jgi:dienelactone hydrolase
MLTGAQPFKGGVPSALTNSIFNDDPVPVEQVRSEVPAELAAVVRKALAKGREARHAHAGALWQDLTRVQQTLFAPLGFRALLGAAGRTLRRPVVALPLAAAIVLAAIGGAIYVRMQSQVRWARQEALPKIRELSATGAMATDYSKYEEAFALARRAEQHLRGDKELAALWAQFTGRITITTSVPGARVWRKPYASPGSEWQEVGVTPLEKIAVPRGYHRWKYEKEGYEPVLAVSAARGVLHRVLDPRDTLPEGMVRVIVKEDDLPAEWKKALAERKTADGKGAGTLDFFVDRYEETNAQYKKFVEAGGYQKPGFWKHEFVKEGRKLTWEVAMREFVDSTGRPGPSTWEAGDFPSGQADFPVGGVSWYEAAAYAEFVGKELPTAAHWHGASSLLALADTLKRPVMSYLAGFSNFGGVGPARVGATQALDASGTYDMAGNVREWCWNQTGAGRLLRGGAWDDVTYMYAILSQAHAFDRSAKNGVRCVRYLDRASIPEVAFAPVVETAVRDFAKETPVTDEVFKVYRDQFSYNRIALSEKIEDRKEDSADWVREKVSFTAAYGDERMIALLFLPKGVKPPFQAVIYISGNGPPLYTETSDYVKAPPLDFVVKAGRALVYPVLYGTHERNSINANAAMSTPVAKFRDAHADMIVKMGRDFRRTVDYLESRSDFDAARLGYYGVSWGGSMANFFTAIEERLKGSVSVIGGLWGSGAPRSEVDAFNYAPRVRLPTLMLNGRYDMAVLLQSRAEPMFKLLGTPPEHKRQIVYETDHFIPRKDLIKETLAWYDKYLGPVSLKTTP